jgi:hypothetical protein
MAMLLAIPTRGKICLITVFLAVEDKGSLRENLRFWRQKTKKLKD